MAMPQAGSAAKGLEARVSSVGGDGATGKQTGSQQGEYRYTANDAYPAGGHASYAGMPEGYRNVSGANMMRPVDIEAAQRARSRKHRKVALGIVGALAAVYLIGVAVFSNWFLPGTTVGSIDASMKTSSQVASELTDKVSNYSVAVTNAHGFKYQANAREAGVDIDSSAVVKAMHKHQNPWLWPVELVQRTHDETDQFVTSYNQSNLDASIRAAVDSYNETATAPQDATIEYNSKKNVFEVKSEVSGTQLDADAVVQAIERAVLDMDSQLVLDDSTLAQPTRTASDSRLTEAANTATSMVAADITLTLNGKALGELDADDLSDMVVLDDDYNVSVDNDFLTSWVSSFASTVDTVGSSRTYTRPDGKAVTVSGGTYGWQVDQSALVSTLEQDVDAGAKTSVAIPWHLNAVDYNGAGTADWGKRYADVDLSEQHARFYDDNGDLVWEADVITGDGNDPDKATPEGVWYIVRKATNETLKTYNKGKTEPTETKVKYWMPFVGDLDAFHDAWWQPSFGGTMYMDGYGSHGCVNLSTDDAAKLYDLISEGDPVVVHW